MFKINGNKNELSAIALNQILATPWSLLRAHDNF